MRIEIINTDFKPIFNISNAAGTSHGKLDGNLKRAETCYKLGHMSVFEFASFTARIEGISRACAHQLVRHRLASFVEQSQRYTKIDVSGNDWYVMPPKIKGNEQLFDNFSVYMACAAKWYEDFLEEGMKPEDARYILPQATKTAITMRMNIRELFAFLDLRQDKAAQWEIRELANELEKELRKLSDEWETLFDWRKNA